MNDSSPVSVIIPAYNAARYLGQAIESVLGQDPGCIDLIVVDDGSTDATARVAAQFGERLRYVFQPNGGIASALNRGLDMARGEWLGFCAADDLWANGRLAKQQKAFVEYPDVDLVFGHVRQFFSPELGPEITEKYYCPPQPMPGYSLAAMLLQRATFERVGHFDPGYRIGEFVDWYARAREMGLRSHLLPDVVLHRRLHGDNLSIRTANDRGDFVRILKAAMDRRQQG